MKAIVYDRYGSPEVLQLKDVAPPTPRADEVLIRIRAVEATKGDCELRSFRFAVQWFTPLLRLAWGVRRPRPSHRVLGGYFAGEVAARGAAVTRFAVGDRVFGCARLRMGAYAEYAAYPENYSITKLPDGVGFAAAAAALLGGLNALHFLNLGELRAGERILINGAGGSIGLLAIQLARARGAEVTAVDKSDKAALIREAGAHHFIDYQEERFHENGRRYDVVFNMVPSVSLAQCRRSLTPQGRCLLGNPRFADLLRAALSGRRPGRRAHVAFAGETQAELETLGALLAQGTLTPPVDRTLPFARAAEAHRLVETEARLGAVVLVPN